MQLKIDVKSLIAGIALGIIVTAVMGAGVGSADADRFGIAMQYRGSALVQTQDGALYVVNSENGMATRVLHSSALRDNPNDHRATKGKFFFLTGQSQSKSGSEKAPY
jgi:hypothetical protein